MYSPFLRCCTIVPESNQPLQWTPLLSSRHYAAYCKATISVCCLRLVLKVMSMNTAFSFPPANLLSIILPPSHINWNTLLAHEHFTSVILTRYFFTNKTRWACSVVLPNQHYIGGPIPNYFTRISWIIGIMGWNPAYEVMIDCLVCRVPFRHGHGCPYWSPCPSVIFLVTESVRPFPSFLNYKTHMSVIRIPKFPKFGNFRAKIRAP